MRFLSQRIELADGQTQSWITLTRTGNYNLFLATTGIAVIVGASLLLLLRRDAQASAAA